MLCSVMSDSLQPMDCSPPGFSVHGIFQARTRQWVAVSYFRGCSGLRDKTHISCAPALVGGFFTTATPGKTNISDYAVSFFPKTYLKSYILWRK